MFRGKLFILSILATALLCSQLLPLTTFAASDGVPEPCSLFVSFEEPGSRCWFICPQGDGQMLANNGNRISILIKDLNGDPVPGVLASDIWLVGCNDLCLCAGSGSIDADSATNDQGITTISGTMAAGGCDLNGVHVAIFGIIAGCPPTCLSMHVVSPDLSCDGIVNLVDFAIFAPAFNSTSADPEYDPCCDFDCEGDVDLVDFSLFAQHWQHSC
jgi:hypothetical protein